MSQKNGHGHDDHGDGDGHEHGEHEHGHAEHGIADAIPESSLQDKCLLLLTVLAGLIVVLTIGDWSLHGGGATAQEEPVHSGPAM